MKSTNTVPSSSEKLAVEQPFSLEDLVEQVRQAVYSHPGEECVPFIRSAIQSAIRNHHGFLPERFMVPHGGCYARREIHTDPEGRFSMLAMVWDGEQGTPLHDHDGKWVVECVYQGRMRVRDYEYLGISDGLHQFSSSEDHFDDPGMAIHRLPPQEHHVLQNANSVHSVTIHVFGGAMQRCHVFEEAVGGYRKIAKTLEFTSP